MSNTELSPDTVLGLAPNLRTRLTGAGHVLLDTSNGTVVDLGPHGFTILAQFAPPLPLGDALARLEAAWGRSTEFAPAVNVVTMLIEEEALVEPDTVRPPTGGWADPVEHARMLHDERRTQDFVDAVQDAVRPGDVALEIGTGSGVLAVALARAGARHVYAVEASDIARVAAEVFDRNGVADRVTLVPGWSREIELPERADLLVSEIIGNEPLEEELLETVVDARRRLLAPGARMVPHALELLARPLRLPEAELRSRAFGRAAVGRWRDLYGIEFDPLLDASDGEPVHTLSEGEVVGRWPAAGPVAVLGRIDLTTLEDASLRCACDLEVDSPAPVNGVAVTFRAHLHGDRTHTLDPWRWPSSSWATSVWVLPDGASVRDGEALRVEYRRRLPGVPDGLGVEVVTRGG